MSAHFHFNLFHEVYIASSVRFSLVQFILVALYAPLDASRRIHSEVIPVYTIEQTSSKHHAGLMEPCPLAQM